MKFLDWYEQHREAIHKLEKRQDVAFYVWNNRPTTSSRTYIKNEGGYTSEFELFWGDYPNKIGKGHAYTAWKKIKGVNLLLDQIRSAIEWQKKTDQWKSENGKYIPHPTTWLNARRWEDERPAVALAGSGEWYIDMNGCRRQRV